MKLIQLTQGKFVQVDDEDFDFLNQWKWFASKAHHTYYARRNTKVGEGGKRTSIPMHRVIMKVNDRKILIDHKDHDGLNNCKENIRLATDSGNARNTASRINSTSKYVGVSINTIIKKGKTYKYWTANIRLNNKQNHIGHFKSEENAAIAYNIMAEKHFGEFANLNTL